MVVTAALAAGAVAGIAQGFFGSRNARKAREALINAENRSIERIKQALTLSLQQLQDPRFRLDTSAITAATDEAQGLQRETLDFVRSQRGALDTLSADLRQIAVAQSTNARISGAQQARAASGGRGLAFGTAAASLAGRAGAAGQAGVGASLLQAETQGQIARAQQQQGLAGLQNALISQQLNIAQQRALPLAFEQFRLAPQQQAILNQQQGFNSIGQQGLQGNQSLALANFQGQQQLFNSLLTSFTSGATTTAFAGGGGSPAANTTTVPGVTS